MRSAFLAMVAVLVVGQAPVSAQEDAGLWGTAETLLWWTKSSRIPPLVTAGQPVPQVLVDDLGFDSGVRAGGRFALGYHFLANPAVGVDASFLFVPTRTSVARFPSAGDPVLSQPFVDAVTGRPDSQGVAFPGVAVGTVEIAARTGLWGADANLSYALAESDRFHVAVLGGFRYLNLADQLTNVERFQVLPGVPGFGGNFVSLQDDFRTTNNFYGGQLGFEAGVRFDRLTFDLRSKFAVGQMQQSADVAGLTSVLSPKGTTTTLPGGLYALRPNSGHFRRSEFAFVPEVSCNVGWQLTSRMKVTVGYSFLWVSAVARAGEQIDPVLNPSQIPVKSPPGPIVGPARPAFRFTQDDFWAQGVNLGLELRY